LFLLLPTVFGFRGLYFAPLLADAPFAMLAAYLMHREWSALGAPARSDREPLGLMTADTEESRL
jgi:hypothetical protein